MAGLYVEDNKPFVHAETVLWNSAARLRSAKRLAGEAPGPRALDGR